MNFLAHAFLAQDTPDSILGAMMGDFVKGPLDGRYGETITAALRLHRAVDTFTDSHPVARTSRHRISLQRRRFAGIMVDVFYDHFLARDWREYSSEPLDRFTRRVYRVLLEHRDVLPDRLQRIAPSMAQLDWLGSYRQIEAIHTALDRMGRRLKRENRLLGAAVELSENYSALERDFREFFPQLLDFASTRQRENVSTIEPSSV